MIGAFQSPIVPLFRQVVVTSAVRCCTVLLLLCFFFLCGHPCFRNFNSAIPVDVVRVKSYVDSFLDPTCVPVRVSINKLNVEAILLLFLVSMVKRMEGC